jgi:hypothetical protein
MKRLTFLVGCLIFLGASLAMWIAPERMTTKAAGMNALLPAPIKITPFTMKTVASKPGRNSSESDSWVNKPIVQVENISGKTIKYLTLQISFQNAESFKLPFMLGYGQDPGQKSVAQTADVLQPGAKINLTMGVNACDRVKASLLASGVQPPSGSRVTTRINGVIFTDGTAWFDGLQHVQDRNDPLKWYVVGESPGRAILNSVPGSKTVKTSYNADSTAASMQEEGLCWKRLGSQYVNCCGFSVASGVFVQVFGGILQPRYITTDCGDGTTCSYAVSQECGLP